MEVDPRNHPELHIEITAVRTQAKPRNVGHITENGEIHLFSKPVENRERCKEGPKSS